MNKKKTERLTRKLHPDQVRHRMQNGCPVCGKALIVVAKLEIDMFTGEQEYAGTYVKCPDSYTADETHRYYMGNFGRGLVREANIGDAAPLPAHLKRRKGAKRSTIPLRRISVKSLASLRGS